MESAREHLIMVLECRASNRVKARVAERMNEGTCLGQCPDKSECTEKARCRGLCSKCERRWRNLRVRMSPSAAAAFDARLIRAGRLLSPREVVEMKDKSCYRLAAQ